MTTGPTGIVVVLIVTVAVVVVVGLVWRARQGRVRPGRTSAAGAPSAAVAGVLPEGTADHGDVTLLLLSTPVCARCPQARAVLDEFVATTEGVGQAELDLAQHPELPAELGVRSTPTMLALSPSGRELFRVVGVPRRVDLAAALQRSDQTGSPDS